MNPDSQRIRRYAEAVSQEFTLFYALALDGSTDRKISNNADSKLVYHRPLWSRDETTVVSILVPRVSFVDEISTWKV